MRCLFCLMSLSLLAGGPRFTIRDAIQAEWTRQPLNWTEAQKAALPIPDRMRLEQTIRRIGAPGTPGLIPPELEQPTTEAWETLAKAARNPQERFTAVYFLNRLKSPRALVALAGLTPVDAVTWPKHLHLESSIATAQLNGAEVSADLQVFLDALLEAGKVDPVRAQAARLRLVLAGRQKELLPRVRATPGSILALLDAWNRAPWTQRRELALQAFRSLSPESEVWPRLGLQRPDQPTLDRACLGILSRLSEGVPSPAPAEVFQVGGSPWPCSSHPLAKWYGFLALAKLETALPFLQAALRQEPPLGASNPMLVGVLLPVFRHQIPEQADQVRDRLLCGPDPIARAAAIEDLPSVPTTLDALTRLAWNDSQLDSREALIQSYARWNMTPEDQKTQLRPWLQHPDWACRSEAYQALLKLDPATPWPTAPKAAKDDKALLKEAVRLAERGKPIRLRLSLSGRRSFTLKLDPKVAPMNVANLVLLARKGYFDGRLVPRVVPDFVVQMGSPCDTLDGGPGYTVRCEDSLAWYGPGSVGMALSVKDSGGSQFFITTNATPHLTGRYTRLGEVEDIDRAMDVLDDLEVGARILSIRVL
jgi:cyclophilin family peptidyl-prolyl cis-trans isomerase